MKQLFLTISFLFSCSLLGTAITEDDFFTDLGTFDHDKTNNNAGINSVHWLECGGKKYLAIGGGDLLDDDEGGPTGSAIGDNGFNIRVLKFDNFNGGTLTALPGGSIINNITPGGNQVHGTDTAANVNSVQWIDCGINKFLAIGGGIAMDTTSGTPVPVTTRVYLFDPVDETIVQKSFADHGDVVNSVAWLNCDGEKFLAAGGDAFNDIGVRIYKVDPSQPNLSVTEKINIDDDEKDVTALAWLNCGDDKFLAVGTDESTVSIYKFSCATLNPTNPPSLVDESVVQVNINAEDLLVSSLAWLICDGIKYLAVASEGNGITGNPVNGTVKLYVFDPVAETLSSVSNAEITSDVPSSGGEDEFTSVAWLNCGETKYLATGNNDKLTLVYKFDPNANPVFTKIISAERDHEVSVNSVAWLQCGALTFLGMGGDNTGGGDTTNRVYQVNFNEDPINELLRNKFFQLHDAVTSPGATAGL